MPEPTDGFGLDHLPYGVYSVGAGAPRVGVRLGDAVLDVATVRPELDRPTLNDFMALGPAVWAETRAEIAELAAADGLPATPLADARLHLPFAVGDYVDFYASLDHASNVGRIFRPDQEPLLPNWRHLPVGYHGRAGTVVVSGTPVVRPCGQRKAPTEASAPDVRAEPAPRHRGRAGLRGRVRAPSAAAGSPSVTSPTTCSASSASTTGRPATSRPGSTCRSAPSSASRSRRRSAPG